MLRHMALLFLHLHLVWICLSWSLRTWKMLVLCGRVTCLGLMSFTWLLNQTVYGSHVVIFAIHPWCGFSSSQRLCQLCPPPSPVLGWLIAFANEVVFLVTQLISFLTKVSPAYQSILAYFLEIVRVRFSPCKGKHGVQHNAETHGPPFSTPALHLDSAKAEFETQTLRG